MPKSKKSLYAKPNTGRVAQEIEKLMEVRARIHRYTRFGDDIHAAIDAQIEVLNHQMTEEQIFECWDIENRREEYSHNAASDARKWLDGEAVPPAQDWSLLLPE